MAGVANIHTDVFNLWCRIVCHLRFSFFSACRTIDSSKNPFMRAEHASQRFFCTIAFAAQYADDRLTAASGQVDGVPFTISISRGSARYSAYGWRKIHASTLWG